MCRSACLCMRAENRIRAGDCIQAGLPGINLYPGIQICLPGYAVSGIHFWQGCHFWPSCQNTTFCQDRTSSRIRAEKTYPGQDRLNGSQSASQCFAGSRKHRLAVLVIPTQSMARVGTVSEHKKIMTKQHRTRSSLTLRESTRTATR